MKNNIVYGMGKVGKTLVKNYIDKGITNLTLVDSDENLWNQEYCGFQIHNPDEMNWSEYNLIIVAVGRKYREEVYNILLTHYGVEEESISFIEEILELPLDVFNMGEMQYCQGAERNTLTTYKKFFASLDPKSVGDLAYFFFAKEHKPMVKWLHYFDAYEKFFSRYRGKDVVILEIGVAKGGSLQMWKNYFNDGDNKVTVYGIDIDPKCKSLEEEDITIFIGSQEDRVFLREIKDRIGKVDILIDDGGHTMTQQIATFEELFDLVAEDGVYLCEDLHTSYYKEFGGGYKDPHSFIEYSKNLVDYINAQYSESKDLKMNIYSETIKYITYCDSMIFIEKKKPTRKSLNLYLS